MFKPVLEYSNVSWLFQMRPLLLQRFDKTSFTELKYILSFLIICFWLLDLLTWSWHLIKLVYCTEKIFKRCIKSTIARKKQILRQPKSVRSEDLNLRLVEFGVVWNLHIHSNLCTLVQIPKIYVSYVLQIH